MEAISSPQGSPLASATPDAGAKSFQAGATAASEMPVRFMRHYVIKMHGNVVGNLSRNQYQDHSVILGLKLNLESSLLVSQRHEKRVKLSSTIIRSHINQKRNQQSQTPSMPDIWKLHGSHHQEKYPSSPPVAGFDYHLHDSDSNIRFYMYHHGAGGEVCECMPGFYKKLTDKKGQTSIIQLQGQKSRQFDAPEASVLAGFENILEDAHEQSVQGTCLMWGDKYERLLQQSWVASGAARPGQQETLYNLFNVTGCSNILQAHSMFTSAFGQTISVDRESRTITQRDPLGDRNPCFISFDYHLDLHNRVERFFMRQRKPEIGGEELIAFVGHDDGE